MLFSVIGKVAIFELAVGQQSLPNACLVALFTARYGAGIQIVLRCSEAIGLPIHSALRDPSAVNQAT